MRKKKLKSLNDPYGFIYKTTINDGRYYIGQHKIINQQTLDPTYYGSGVVIKDFIKSKGKDALTREILAFGFSHEEMNELESHFITEDILKDPLNINLDTGGRHIYSRYQSINAKIGESISRLRKEYPEKWPSRYGEQNNKSVHWKLISPEGKEFLLIGSLDSFCKEKGISQHTIRKAVREGWIPRRGPCAGWKAFNLDKNIGTTREPENRGEARSGKNNPYYKHGNNIRKKNK
jgi:hypothetical protein